MKEGLLRRRGKLPDLECATRIKIFDHELQPDASDRKRVLDANFRSLKHDALTEAS